MSKLIEMIKEHEGVVPHAYQDSRGYWTIGVGRLIDEKLGGGLSDGEIDYLLANDLKRCRKEAEEYSWFNKLNEPRQAVILSMLFNLGKPNFDKFKNMQAAMEEGDHMTASNEMLDSLWAGQVGRRAIEMSEMMQSGEWHE
ncbi:Phage-related lysozyme (muraminidase) (COG3772) [uncultured Mediterranean phage uvMED]|nr:Phage-related lysozyme (muraminidase) (COG3772) [uncultured Mediterranean phage uvMED]BAQ90338.1 Phage-related lysozyme (muraminidase) (COG3772) [uncultured Mediterranean phage uvMED]